MGFRLQGAGLTHANGFAALSDIDLAAERGERIALIGPSGAGKTSLLALLGTALAPTAGTVSILGVRLAGTADGRPAGRVATPPRALRARIGTVYQAPPIPGRQRVVTAVLAGRIGQWPAWKSALSLLHPLDIPGARAALARLDLAERCFDRCDRLSGGQLQRVGVARVLYQQAELVLADEPVSALDPALAESTVRLLTEDAAARGATLVASLHAVDLALAYFSRIVGIRQGRIAFDLPVGQIDEDRLRALYAGEEAALEPNRNASRAKPFTNTEPPPPEMPALPALSPASGRQSAPDGTPACTAAS